MDPFSTEVAKNPYPYYQELCSSDPIHHFAADTWLITKYSYSDYLLRDERLVHWWQKDQRKIDPFARLAGKWLSFLHPSFKSRANIVNIINSISNRCPNSLDEIITVTAQDVREKLLTGCSIDLIADYCLPITVQHAIHLLGVPKKYKSDLMSTVMTLKGLIYEAVVPSLRLKEIRGLRDLVDEILFVKHADQQTDIISILLKSGSYTREELVSFCVLFLIAATDNLTGFLGNALLTLINHSTILPDLAEREIPFSMLEELLRYEPPVQLVKLIPIENVELGSKTLLAGQVVFIAIGAANRDPEIFSHPQVFDITRNPNSHLSFGRGPLACIGAMYSRNIIQKTISSIYSDIPQYYLKATSVEWSFSPPIMRRVTSLPVIFHKSGSIT